ncbi:hypothetical protein ACQEVZ_24755 [Dactylosporangium sp. CA-152071]|uniref:hypothetical protein n=1 Tax=Dactylosporangium sp. CA-152071 TaxID=3239933 RepID=UPI003D89D659
MAPLHVGGMDGMTEAEALWSYRTITTGLPETIDGTTRPVDEVDPAFKAKQLTEWQDLLDEVRDYLADDASPEAREYFAGEQRRIDAFR